MGRLRKMRVVSVIHIVSLFVFLQNVFGISNKEEKLLDEEYRRGAEDVKTTNNYDQLQTETFKKNIFQKNLGIYGYGDGSPRSGYSVHEGTNMLYGHNPEVAPIYGHSNDLSNIYGYNSDLAQIYKYSSGAPHLAYSNDLGHAYGHGTDLGHAYGHSADLGHTYGHAPYIVHGYGHGTDLAHSYGYGHEEVDHGHHYDSSGFGITGIGNYFKKKLTLKKLFLPLAGIALIAAAGALSTSNPILLQLGTISATTTGRGRVKRSDVKQNIYPTNPFLKIKNKREK